MRAGGGGRAAARGQGAAARQRNIAPAVHVHLAHLGAGQQSQQVGPPPASTGSTSSGATQALPAACLRGWTRPWRPPQRSCRAAGKRGALSAPVRGPTSPTQAPRPAASPLARGSDALGHRREALPQQGPAQRAVGLPQHSACSSSSLQADIGTGIDDRQQGRAMGRPAMLPSEASVAAQICTAGALYGRCGAGWSTLTWFASNRKSCKRRRAAVAAAAGHSRCPSQRGRRLAVKRFQCRPLLP